MTFNKIFFLLVALSVMTLFACKKDENDNARGRVHLEITDAPVDDASIKAVFVTIADIKLNGTSIEGFSRKTVDLLSLRNGNTALLIDAEVRARNYGELTLVLDTESQPGCYVEENNGNKFPLSLTSNEIVLSYNFDVSAEQTTNLVIDFDLRKAITRDQENKYAFVTEAELNKALRIVDKESSGKLNGVCTDLVTNSDVIMVYAYKKGTFNRDTEVTAQGQSDVLFSNAITSGKVEGNGNYSLHFLNDGEYELHFASYKNNAKGELELRGTLVADVASGLNLTSIQVGAGANITINITVTGILLV
jgi:hypothetical protein